jgi:uncharacterized protein with von Willebrand factor type A (vWA) domain
MAEYESLFADNSNALKSLEEALFGLWDRMKKAVERIEHLTQENSLLSERNKELEQAALELQQHVEKKSKRIEELESGHASVSGIDAGDGVFYLSNEERVELENRIDELLRKIESHLSS